MNMPVIPFLSVSRGPDFQNRPRLTKHGEISIYGTEAEIRKALLQICVYHVGCRMIVAGAEILKHRLALSGISLHHHPRLSISVIITVISIP